MVATLSQDEIEAGLGRNGFAAAAQITDISSSTFDGKKEDATFLSHCKITKM
jgi:hypothetical protein